MKNKKLSILFGLFSALLSPQSNAAPQHYPAVDQIGGNATLWRITFYDDTSGIHTQWASQDICLIQGPVQGSNTTGLWYSTTYYRWIGRWRQEGDQIAMTGDFWTGPGNDSMRWEITAADREGSGHWEEWVEDGAYGAWLAKGNAKLVKLGPCLWKPPVVTWLEMEKLVLEQASLAPHRVREDGTEPYPSDRLQLPLR
jgi:hypothetical protein